MAALNCSTLTGTMQTMCDFMYAQANPVTCGGLEFLGDSGCEAYESPLQKLAGKLGGDATLDTGNTAWMMISSAFVMIMTPGLALFYGGLTGQSSVSNTIMMCLTAMCLVTVQWFLVGYSFAFGPGNEGFGSFAWACLISITSAPSGAYGAGIPHYVWVAFQCMFAQLTPALICGAVVGRMKFLSFAIFVLIWTTVIYDPLAHWVWSLTVNDEGGVAAAGWLGVLGAADFAGGAVIHISSGFAALAAALVVGKRHDYGKPVKPHNVPMVIIGASLLWFGWFGFNAGSAGGAAGTVPGDVLNTLAGTAFINTHIAAGMAAFTWMLCEKLVDSSPTAAGAASGIVAGLVAITPACGFVTPWASTIIGAVVSPFCYGAVKLKGKLGVDDTLDAWGIHGIGGVVGAFMTGLFADPAVNPFYAGAFYGNPKLLGYEIVAILVSASFSFVGSFIILKGLEKTIGVRISEDVETAGIDVSEHGGAAYQSMDGPAANFTVNSQAIVAAEPKKENDV